MERRLAPAPAAAPAAGHGVARRSEHPLLALRRKAGNRAVAQMLQRDDIRRQSSFMPESPTVNIAALNMQGAFASSIRRLTQREKDVARPV